MPLFRHANGDETLVTTMCVRVCLLLSSSYIDILLNDNPMTTAVTSFFICHVKEKLHFVILDYN